MSNRYILTLQCPDTVGIVAAVATFLADRGLSIEETAHVLGLSLTTVKAEWRMARAWLYRQLEGSP